MKNDHIGISIPYLHRGTLARVLPDINVHLDGDEVRCMMVGLKGWKTLEVQAKTAAMER